MVKHIQHHLACLGGLALISISILVTSCNKTMDMEQQVDELYARMSPQERIAQLCSIYMDLLFDEQGRLDTAKCRQYIPNGIGHFSQFAMQQPRDPTVWPLFRTGSRTTRLMAYRHLCTRKC